MRNQLSFLQGVSILIIFQFVALLPSHASATHTKTAHIYGHYKDGPKSIWLYYWLTSSDLGPTYVKTSVDPASGTFEFHINLKYPALLQLENQFFIAVPDDTVKVDIVATQSGPQIKFNDRRYGRNFFEDVMRKFKPFPFDKVCIHRLPESPMNQLYTLFSKVETVHSIEHDPSYNSLKLSRLL